MKVLKELRHIPDFIKLPHTVFAMPFGLAALVLAAGGFPGWRTLGLVIAAMIFARTAAMAFNRIADARYDALNPRTAARHLPTGKISVSTAWGVVAAASVMFVLVSVCINSLAGWLSPVALAVILGYSYTKRFTSLSHFFLGTALAIAPVGAWVAVRATLDDPVPWLLSAAVVCWVAGFDMIYSLQDSEFDKTHGLHSMVVTLGPEHCLMVVGWLHLVMLCVLVCVGLQLRMGWPYYAGLTVVLAGLTWEQALARRMDSRNLRRAFLQANAVASFGYLAAVIAGVYFGG